MSWTPSLNASRREGDVLCVVCFLFLLLLSPLPYSPCMPSLTPDLFYHFIVYVPETHGDAIRNALAEAGAGKIGNYDACSFTLKGTGRFRPLKGSDPAIGQEGTLEEVEEERIEVMLSVKDASHLKKFVEAVRAVHPYEEPVIQILPTVDYH